MITKEKQLGLLYFMHGNDLESFDAESFHDILKYRLYMVSDDDRIIKIIYNLLRVHKEAKEGNHINDRYDNLTRKFGYMESYINTENNLEYIEKLTSDIDALDREIYKDFFKYYAIHKVNAYIKDVEEHNRENLRSKRSLPTPDYMMDMDGYFVIHHQIYALSYWYLGKKETDKILKMMTEQYLKKFHEYHDRRVEGIEYMRDRHTMAMGYKDSTFKLAERQYQLHRNRTKLNPKTNKK